jgi:hypothetical protein
MDVRMRKRGASIVMSSVVTIAHGGAGSEKIAGKEVKDSKPNERTTLPRKIPIKKMVLSPNLVVGLSLISDGFSIGNIVGKRRRDGSTPCG